MGEIENLTGPVKGVLIAVLLYYFILLSFGIVKYILYSNSLYRISTRRGINNAGLAWVPVVRNWLIGAIVDKYEADRNNVTKNWKKVLTCFVCIAVAGYILYLGLSVFVALSGMVEDFTVNDIGMLAALLAGFVVLFIGVLGLSACKYVCYYKIFESCSMQKATKYFLITFLVPFALPFVFHHIQNMDDMPPLNAPQLNAPVGLDIYANR